MEATPFLSITVKILVKIQVYTVLHMFHETMFNARFNDHRTMIHVPSRWKPVLKISQPAAGVSQHW